MKSADRCRVVHRVRVRQARSRVVPEPALLRLSHLFKALGDPTRLKLMMALRQGEMCVCDLAAFLELTESAVSHQLRRLRELSLVKRRREAQILYYSLDDEHVSKLLEMGEAHARE
jgi:DNA-binding transcriptional ArsR family regulator